MNVIIKTIVIAITENTTTVVTKDGKKYILQNGHSGMENLNIGNKLTLNCALENETTAGTDAVAIENAVFTIGIYSVTIENINIFEAGWQDTGL